MRYVDSLTALCFGAIATALDSFSGHRRLAPLLCGLFASYLKGRPAEGWCGLVPGCCRSSQSVELERIPGRMTRLDEHYFPMAARAIEGRFGHANAILWSLHDRFNRRHRILQNLAESSDCQQPVLPSCLVSCSDGRCGGFQCLLLGQHLFRLPGLRVEEHRRSVRTSRLHFTGQ